MTFSKAISLWPVPRTNPQREMILLLLWLMVPSGLTSQIDNWIEELSLAVIILSV